MDDGCCLEDGLATIKGATDRSGDRQANGRHPTPKMKVQQRLFGIYTARASLQFANCRKRSAVETILCHGHNFCGDSLLFFKLGRSRSLSKRSTSAWNCHRKAGVAIGIRGKLCRFNGRRRAGARDAGGKVTGITPRLMVDKGLSDQNADELLVTNDMRDRKALLEQRGDAFVALPGGLGTYEEVFEILVGRQLGYHNKPIVLLNLGDYYRPLLEMVEHGIDQKFIKPAARELFFVAGNIEEGIEYLKRDVKRISVDKWFEGRPPSAVE